MKIINRTNKNLTIKTYRSGDPVYTVSENYDWIYPGQTIDYPHGADNIKILIADDIYKYWGPFSSIKGDVCGDFNWDHTVILVEGNANRINERETGRCTVLTGGFSNTLGAIDWTSTYNTYIAGSPPTTPATDTISQQCQIGLSILTGLATGLAAAGPELALPAGGIAGLAAIIIMAINPQQPLPSPPTIGEITDAIRTVVQDQLNRKDAMDAANLIDQAGHWCVRWTQMANALTGAGSGDFTESEKGEFRQDLHDWLFEQSDFQVYLNKLRGNSEISKYVIPSFITGLSTDLQMSRIQLMDRILRGHTLIDADISGLMDRVTSAGKALGAAKTAFTQFCQDTVASYLNVGTAAANAIGEASVLRNKVTKTYTGSDDLNFVDTAAGQLGDVINGLKQDSAALKANQPPKRIWPRSLHKPT